MGAKEEFLGILQKVWTKLQDLQHAGPLEMGAFFILILFFATFLVMILLPCIQCCCCCCCKKPKYQASRVQPLQPA